MKRPRLRSALPLAAIVLGMIAGWHWFAPTQVGGTTTYVGTNGISMEPRFHTGDLAIVRPAASYRVGQIVAYRSSLLHVIVLHRIVALHGSHYVFKGDNNHFLDPTRPVRSQLIGALWVRVPHGAAILHFVHEPVVAAVLIAIVALLMLAGTEQARRRRRRRRSATPPPSRMRPPSAGPGEPAAPLDLRPWLIGSASATAALLALCVLALANPASHTVNQPLRFTQSVRFGYGARVAPGPVYPDGQVHTGQPIFLRLARRVRVWSDYRLAAPFPHRVSGTAQMMLVLSGPSGWTRSLALSPPTRFAGPHVLSTATLDLPSLQRLLAQIQQLTGVSAGGGYTLAVQPRIRVSGTLGGRPLHLAYAPALDFELQALQLQPGGGSTSSNGPPGGGFTRQPGGSVAHYVTLPNHLRVLGASIAVAPLRVFSLTGLLLATAASVFLLVLLKAREPYAESERIRIRHGHLLVPVVAGPDTLDRVPYDVTSIDALVRLAESGERLILHHRDPLGDTYLVSDDSAVFRYHSGPARVVWGEWSPARVEDRTAPEAGSGDPAPPPAPGPDEGVPLAAFESAVAGGSLRPSTVRAGWLIPALGLLAGLRRGRG